MNNYEIPLDKISLHKFKSILQTKRILPSRTILLETIDERFSTLEEVRIRSVKGLIDTLKSSKLIDAMAQKTGIPIDYLTILKREASSYKTKPEPMKAILPEDQKLLDTLASAGIKNSRQFYENCYNARQREALSSKLKIDETVIEYMLKLCDLLRINGVGPIFARMMIEGGIESVNIILTLSEEEIYDTYNQIRLSGSYADIPLSRNDIRYCKEMAGLLPPGPNY
ncbi:MAG: DUF4332 domain-containing protein [Bacteroidales bacterium]|nr:DUF4332 domain-containing protein [Bacteroidales bacterium]MCF8454974.1 DUF4332 domain-containing protein [Bacteroidales bacterium]